jgi:hypothetical protein
MQAIAKTTFSEMTALELATVAEIIEIQSHGETVGYYIPVGIMGHINAAIDWMRSGNIEKATWHINEMAEGQGEGNR